MFMSILVLVVSTALFLFYLQTACEQALRREFSQSYFKEIIQAAQLEYPKLLDAVASNGLPDYRQARLDLKCDFFTLESLLKRVDPTRQHLTRGERLLGLYFRFMFFSLPIRHALKLKERETVLRLASILQFFANSVGEKLSVNAFAVAETRLNS
ncbi:MAG: hypothetical protein WB819_06505 [Terriglobia bacterium]|jgi:hypothetical protein